MESLNFNNIPTIAESINEDKSRGSSLRKKEMRSLQKHTSSPSMKNIFISLKAQEENATNMSKDNIEES